MRARHYLPLNKLPVILVLVCLPLAASEASPPCVAGGQASLFGDGSNGILVLHPQDRFALTHDSQYEQVTIDKQAVLNTQGHVLRVRDTLRNFGLITDRSSGGTGGEGGAGGDGGHGYPHHAPTTGNAGEDGNQPSHPAGGRGGDAGGGGGGGGGAWNSVCFLADTDTPGGDGGDGGHGGDGGGYVLIYAYYFDNQGIIEADGEHGEDGGHGGNGDFDDYYCPPAPEWEIYHRDQAGGGGGGGAGGDGGSGGTVEIHFVHLINEGEVHADPGLGGDGGLAGNSPCGALDNPAKTPQQHWEPGASGADGGGAGGESDIGTQCGPNQAEGGIEGTDGAEGQVLWVQEQFDVLHYDLSIEFLDVTPPQGEISGQNVMTVKCLVDGVSMCSFRLDRLAFPEPSVFLWDEPSQDWVSRSYQWLPDNITAVVDLEHTFDADEEFKLRVDYGGNPRIIPESRSAMGVGNGMFFMEHGDGYSTPIVFTTVEPWFAYLWWPVKNDGDNWNCDKATLCQTYIVPSWMTVVANGDWPPDVQVNGDWKTVQWTTEYPMPAYLVSMAATDYDEVSLASDVTDVRLYVWPEDNNPPKWAEWGWVTEMLELYSHSDRFGEYAFADEKYAIYQWPKIGQAMEHQTNAGQPGAWGKPRVYAPQWTTPEWHTCHELAHQWWGDLVSCASWHDIWLNEGLACWSETLWFETQWNRPEMPFLLYDCPQDSLRDYVRWAHMPVWSALAKSLYVYDVSHSDNILDFELQYMKGPRVLHGMRHLVDPEYDDGNTEKFFEILRTYRESRAPEDTPGCATVPDFQEAAETVCLTHNLYDLWATYQGHPGGAEYQDLDWFFEEWVYDSGAPAYFYRSLASPPGVFCFRIRQVQPDLCGDRLFAMPLDVQVRVPGHDAQEFIVWNDSSVQDYEVAVPIGRPRMMRLDPNHWVLRRFAMPFFMDTLTNLGPTVSTTEPTARLNNTGQVITTPTIAGEDHACCRLALADFGLPAGNVLLGTLGGAWSRAFDVNDEGQVVGESSTASGQIRAFIWLPQADGLIAAGMHALSDVGVEDGARGLNHFRQVVGYSIDAESHRCAVLWEDLLADGTWVSTILPGLGGLESEARAINNSGQIAGWSKTSSNEVRAVVWEYQGADEGWTTTVLGEAGLDSFAFGINGKGDVVGQEGGLPLLWERAEYQAPSSEPPWQPVPLPTGPRQDATGAAFGINAAGQVVGALDGDAALWLLEPAYGLPMGLFLLNDYPALLGKTAPDLHFQVAWDINDGMQIVGYGELNGETQILLLDFQGEPDCNGNGVIDMCDTPGDFDGSGFVDLADYEVLADCLDGPALLAQEYCLCLLDSDHDGDVDLNDFILLQRSFAVQ